MDDKAIEAEADVMMAAPAVTVNRFIITANNILVRIMFGEQSGDRTHPRSAVLMSVQDAEQLADVLTRVASDLKSKAVEPTKMTLQ